MAKDDVKRGAGEMDMVGRCHPPKEHRIKSGEIRNPWGRRGRPQSEKTFMDESITLRIDGKTRSMPRSAAVTVSLFKEAMAGNVSAAKELNRLTEALLSGSKEGGEEKPLPSGGEEALNRLIQRRVDEALKAAEQTKDAAAFDPGGKK